MAIPNAALLSVAESVADGEAIDWAAAEQRATAEQQPVIHQLRVLADLAKLHRSLPAAPGAERTSATTSAIGTWGHLALLERLGRGSFGEVYRAWDRHLEREVALKLLHRERTPDHAPSLSHDTTESEDDPRITPVLREARLLARVRHANVVHVYGVAIHERQVGLWMELIRGETLEQLLVRSGPFNAREAALIGIDLCRALAAIHSAGLIHRDIKAQNVMRETGGRIVLMDLGTGRRSGPRAWSDFAGTPLYLAPEIFEGLAASERSDIYSVGVLLYHLVTGAFPVSAASVTQLDARHAARARVQLRDARADLPTEFVSVVDRALEDSDHRYRSAGELEAALVGSLQTGGAAVVHDAPIAVDRRPRAGRWRVGVAAAAVAVILTLGGAGWALVRDRWIAPPAPLDSIAVLPVVNMSGDPAQEYFADGITEAVIGSLAKIRPLRVISRTSVMPFKGTKQRIGDIAKTLGVDAVLEASVLQMGDHVRLSAHLVEAATDHPLWTETYERNIRDVLALQNDLARAIAQAVRVRLSSREQAAFATRAQVEPAAQDAYFRGRYYWDRRTDEGLQTALAYFREAARLDSSFAKAYAGQADAYNLLPGGLSPSIGYPLAKDAARRALDIDPALAEAHTSLAFAEFISDRDWQAAEAGFRRAIDLSPGYATAHHWYADFLTAMGRYTEAFAQFDEARSLDPLSAPVRADTGNALLLARRYDDAVTELQSALALDAQRPILYYYLGRAYEQRGMPSEAAAAVERGLKLAPRDPYLLAQSGRLAALKGDRAAATNIARDLVATARPVSMPIVVAQVYAALGEADRVFEFLNRAETERAPSLLWIENDPMFDFLRIDRRWTELLRRLRLEP